MNWRTIVLSLIFLLSQRLLKNWFFLSYISTAAFSVCQPIRKQHRNCTSENSQWPSPRLRWWEYFYARSFGPVSSLWHDRPQLTTSPTSTWFRNIGHGPGLIFILPYKPHSVCQHPQQHIRASCILFRCSTGISPWACPLRSLCSCSFFCNWKAFFHVLIIATLSFLAVFSIF